MTTTFSIDNEMIEEIETSVIDLILSIQENQNSSLDNEKLDELIELMKTREEKELIESEKEEVLTEKEEVELDLMNHLLAQDELTPEEQEELDALLLKEETFQDLEQAYYEFNVNNQEQGFDALLSTADTLEEIVEQNNLIIAQNEITNNADHVFSIYGLVVFPALIIIFVLWRIIKPFLP